MSEESATLRASYARVRIGVENRDSHQLSQNETLRGQLTDDCAGIMSFRHAEFEYEPQ